jgi:hypothetical protein
MDRNKETSSPKKEKKVYVKPTAVKHKAASLVVGSSNTQGCYYTSKMFGTTYYH